MPSVLMGEVHFNSGRRVGKSRVRAEHTRGTRRDVYGAQRNDADLAGCAYGLRPRDGASRSPESAVHPG